MFKSQLLNIIKMAILPSLIIYFFIIVITSYAGIDTELVLRDLLQTCDFPIGVGMISSLGVILWASATAINLFAAGITHKYQVKYSYLLVTGGLLSGLLCLDDLFLIHDKRQITQDILYTLYIILSLYIILKFSKLISEIDTLSFFTSCSLLGLSIISDIFQDFLPISYQTVQIFEEGFKFTGISCWLYFWSKASKKAIKV